MRIILIISKELKCVKEDISFNPVYATLLGFSENEILAYFDDYFFTPPSP